MGYRHYLYVVDRKMIDQIRDLTIEELAKYAYENAACERWEIEDEEGFLPFNFMHVELMNTTFHEFGKYYDNAENIQNLGKPLFSREEVQEHFSDMNPYIVEKDAVICAIEDYKQKIISWYKQLLLPQDEFVKENPYYGTHNISREKRLEHHIERQLSEWENPFKFSAVDLNPDDWSITHSWLYEYQIFNLVHKLKTMYWDTHVLLFVGW